MKTNFGIYLHIPFCSSKCGYCNFYSKVSKDKDSFVSALVNQIKSYPEEGSPKTIYIGGGTPSVLSSENFNEIFSALFSKFSPSALSEFTVEMNPESLNESLFSTLKKGGVNRISLGVQSFNDAELSFANRRHTAFEAEAAIEKIKAAGFENFSVDIIIGLPLQTEKSLKNSLEKAVFMGAKHISAYILKVEENTAFFKKGVLEMPEEEVAKLFFFTSDFLRKNGFEHYEISNFAKKNCRGEHNFSYWKGRDYIAFGPSSYGLERGVRYHYAADLKEYILQNGRVEKIVDETLSLRDYAEEKIMLSLRTADGISTEGFTDEMLSFAKKLTENNLATLGKRLVLTPKGYLLSNIIISELLALYEKG